MKTKQCLGKSVSIEGSGVFQFIETAVGPLEACWTCRGLYSCRFTEKQAFADAGRKVSVGMQQLSEAIAEYFRSGSLCWDLATMDWEGVSDFQKAALQACCEIPSGATLTYGQLAAEIGRPKAARAVGMAMAKNRWPIVIPCHRVLGADRKLTGYSGRGGLETKRQLLRLEAQQRSIDFE